MKIYMSAVALFASTGLVGCAGKTGSASPEMRAAVAAGPVTAKSLLERVKPSLVAVRYTFDGEMGRRELEGAGIVVRDDGLVAFSAGIVPAQLPDAQMINFKVVVPPADANSDETELDATFLGRDERADLAYVKVAGPIKTAATLPATQTASQQAPRAWHALKPVDRPLEIGDTIYTIGLLPKGSGYSAYARSATISAKLRGPTPLILTGGDLTGVGSPAFNDRGEFVAIVPEFGGTNPILNGEDEAAALTAAPMFVVPMDFYLTSLSDPPAAPNARKIPWMGVVQMTGTSKDLRKVYGMGEKVGIQIGDVIPNGAAAKAGLKGGEIITQVDGQDLERGDTPEELPVILGRRLSRMNVNDTVALTVIRKKGAPAEPVKLTLQERPAPASTAARFYAEDLGYTVRDMVFQDRYALKQDESFKGAFVTFVKPQGNAQAGGLKRGDVVTKINQIDVTDVSQFRDAYEKFRKASAKEAVVLEVLRGVDTQIIRIQPPQ